MAANEPLMSADAVRSPAAKILFANNWYRFGSLKFTAFVLPAIATATAVGTLIPQGTAEELQSKFADPNIYQLVMALGLNHVYSSWWFVALLMALFVNLAVCTYLRFPSLITLLKSLNEPRFVGDRDRLRREKLQFELTSQLEDPQAFAVMARHLQRQGYQVSWKQQNEETLLYAQKGAISQVGPWLVHISLFLLLIGVVVGAITGFKTFGTAGANQMISITQVEKSALSFTSLPDWQIKVNKFWIDRLPSGAIDHFYSDISVLSMTGEELTRKTIYVNEPLIYDGVTVYQASWGVEHLKLKVDDQEFPVRMMPWQDKGHVGQLPIVQGGHPLVLFTADEASSLEVYDNKGTMLAQIPPGGAGEVNGKHVIYQSPELWTGLQIKKDPGVEIIWLAFVFMILGLFVGYAPHRQIWAIARREGNSLNLQFAGKGRRGATLYRREFNQVQTALQKELQAS